MNRAYNPSALPPHLLREYERFGGLTAAQLDSLFTPKLDTSAMWECFQSAKRAGVAKPKLHIEGFSFKRAEDSSRNPGAIYVYDDVSGFNEYLGKILDGGFFPTQTCGEQRRQAILKACANPLEAVLAYGKKFGRCSICNRTLTDPESVQMGIGPICRQRFGL
jgi:hypothetical protein